MKKNQLKTIPYFVLILFSACILSANVTAGTGKKEVSSAATKSTAKKVPLETKNKLLAEKQKKLVKEAVEVLSGTREALVALENKDSKKALALLQETSGKLDIILAKSPSMALIPAALDTDIIDFEGNADTVKKTVKDADDLLDEGKIQDARQLLLPLASEIRINTTFIPLGTFPTAIKDAVSLIDKGKTEEAENVLSNILTTLVETTEVFPLPLIRSEALLTEASELEHKKGISKEQTKKDIVKLADAAKEQLQLAVLLGYGNEKDYKTLYTAIDEIKETVHSKKSKATWEKIKSAYVDLKNKLISKKE